MPPKWKIENSWGKCKTVGENREQFCIISLDGTLTGCSRVLGGNFLETSFQTAGCRTRTILPQRLPTHYALSCFDIMYMYL